MTDIVAVLAHWSGLAVGVNVYVVVCVLSTAGLQVPVTALPVRFELLFELVGSVSNAPLHIGPGLVNVGVTLPTTVTVATVELEQLPDVPVTVTVYEFPAITLELDDEKLTLLPVPEERYVVGLHV